MNKSPHILVIPGWYPSYLEPLNGDFIKTQVDLMRTHGLNVDLLYIDLNIAYLWEGQVALRKYSSSDNHQNTETILSGPTWPKNSKIGLGYWLSKASQLAIEHIIRHGHPDIIHAHTYLGGAIADQIKKKLSIPYIVTEHYTGWMTGNYKKSHYNLAVSAYYNADTVTTVSQALHRAMQNLFKIDSKVIPNFIDLDIFKPRETNTSQLHIIGIGDLIPRKQWHILIRAFAQVRQHITQATLTIIGDGPLRAKLQALITKLSLQEHIALLGNLPKIKTAQTLAQSTILIHTSKLESFGLTPIEALACGVPIISSSNGGSDEYADLSGVTILEIIDQETLVKTILGFYERRDIAPSNKLTLRQESIKRFSVDSVAPALLKLYTEFIARSKSNL